jgi:hypothetical protein
MGSMGVTLTYRNLHPGSLLWQVTYLRACRVSRALIRTGMPPQARTSMSRRRFLLRYTLRRYSQDISPTASHSTTPANVQHDSDEPTSLGSEQFRKVMQAHHNRQVPIGDLCYRQRPSARELKPTHY